MGKWSNWLGGVAAAALAVASLLTLAACGGSSSSASPSAVPTPSPAPSPTPAPAPAPAFSTVDLREGTGATAFAGRNVIVTYTGWLYDPTKTDSKGTQFDSGAFAFTVGSGVISGFSQGVIGMQVGGLRRVVIPPNLGYGAAGSPPAIPGNSTLIFEIELLSLQ